MTTGKYALLPLSFLPAQRKIFSCAGRNFSLRREQKIRSEVKEEVYQKNYYIFSTDYTDYTEADTIGFTKSSGPVNNIRVICVIIGKIKGRISIRKSDLYSLKSQKKIKPQLEPPLQELPQQP